MAIKIGKWRQRAPKIIPHAAPSLLLEPSWNQHFSKIAPGTFLGIILVGFGWIFNEFRHHIPLILRVGGIGRQAFTI